MRYAYQGHYSYSHPVISNWNNNQIGVYYCGFTLPNGNLSVLYVGRATGDNGIRGRLLQHLGEDRWPNVTHFGYVVCDTVKDAEDFEATEIARLQPLHNTQGK